MGVRLFNEKYLYAKVVNHIQKYGPVVLFCLTYVKIIYQNEFAQSAGTIEYTDCTSAEE